MTWPPAADKLWFPGPKAVRKPLPATSLAGSWAGQPRGVMLHFTAGCGDPHGTLQTKRLGVLGCVMTDGTFEQYTPTNQWTWHAFEPSRVLFGIEHQCMPTVCDLTEAQLETSSDVVAWLFGDVCGWTAADVKRVKGCGYEGTAIIKVHNDGLEAGCTWDPNGHWDGVFKADNDYLDPRTRAALNRSPWTAAAYIDKVKSKMGGGGGFLMALSDDEQAALLVGVARIWNGMTGIADALGIAHPASLPEDDGVINRGWANATMKQFAQLVQKAAGS
jgi:hypothetical protein